MSTLTLPMRLVRMIVVGGIATVLYAGLSLAGSTALGLPLTLASPLSYGLASIWSYAGHRWLTFGDRQPARRAALRFSALTIAGYGAAAILPAIVGGMFGGPPWLSILTVCVAVPAVNYVILSRHIFLAPALPPGEGQPG